MQEFLRKLYKRFLEFDERYFLKDAPGWFGVAGLKLTPKILKDFYQEYQKVSFLSFLGNLKDIIYAKNVFDFLVKNAADFGDLSCYLKFLEKEGIIKVKKTGGTSLLKKEILEVMPRPRSEKEIKDRIEKKLKAKFRPEEPVPSLFKELADFEIKQKWDQMPVSQSSAVFLVKKILERLPLNKKFLFVGDDDFISVILGIAEPKIESLVIDIDEQVLSGISSLSSKFNLKIATRKVDINQEFRRSSFAKNSGEFVGFLVNPPYTEEGVKEFVKYGKSRMGRDGGVVFLEVGNEAIGNRFLFLQKFFAKENLIINEVIRNKIYYPWASVHREDELISSRLSSMMDRKTVEKSPRLGASLYIFNFLPFKISKVKVKKSIYAYI